MLDGSLNNLSKALPDVELHLLTPEDGVKTVHDIVAEATDGSVTLKCAQLGLNADLAAADLRSRLESWVVRSRIGQDYAQWEPEQDEARNEDRNTPLFGSPKIPKLVDWANEEETLAEQDEDESRLRQLENFGRSTGMETIRKQNRNKELGTRQPQ